MNLLRRSSPPPVSVFRHSRPLTIRWATPADADQLEALAELDEAEIPAPPLMVGFVDDELWAAMSLSTGATISDPFRPSAEVARLVGERGRQLTVPAPGSGLGLARLRGRPSRVSLATRFGQSTG